MNGTEFGMKSNSDQFLMAQNYAIGKAPFDLRTIATGILIFAVYYLGAKIGFALTFYPHPVSVLWPPNSILVAALLLTPPRIWWFVLLAALPAHWAAQLQSQVPPTMIFCWFISNSCEALIGAGLVHYLIGGPLRLTSLRNVGIFCLCVAFTGPFLSSFLDAAFVRWNNWGSGSYWEIWRIRFTSNFLAALTIGSLIVSWATADFTALQKLRPRRFLEAGFILLGLIVVSFGVLYELPSRTNSTVLFLPLPFLLWAAIRFGSIGASTAVSVLAFSAIWSAGHGHGPFSGGSAEQSALAIQMFLIAISLPLMFLAGVIEEHKRAVDNLRESEERYREVVESQTDLVCRFLADSTLTFVNEAYCRFFGLRRHDLIGRKFLDLIPSEARTKVLTIISNVVESRQALTHEHETIKPDGSVGWQQWIDYAIVQPDGSVTELQGIGRDITERVRAETALREREARINLAAESANLALWVYEPERDTAWMSEKGRAIYGFSAGEQLSRASFIGAVHPDEQKIVGAVFDRVRGCDESFEIEHRIAKRDGDIAWVIMRGRSLCNERGEALELIGVTIDITAQKQANLQNEMHRREMAHLSRVAVMGEMAASLAHELNQPLTGIMSNADAGLRLMSSGVVAELSELLSDISTDARRAGDVIRGIRNMVKKGQTVRKDVSLNDVVLNVVRMVKSEAALNSCELETSMQSDLPLVQGDPIEVQQVLLNLILNAFDALRSRPLGSRQIWIATKTNGASEIEVSVRDSGDGISKVAQERLFDQFFTTKPGGLGLGLAIARSIMESHGGTITGESIQSGGSVFRFSLPAKR
jgi:PAS domain S-box-containing protein